MKHLNEIVFKTKFIYEMGNINGHWDIRGIQGLKNNNNNKILIYQKIPRNRSPRSDDMLTSNSKSISHSLAFKISSPLSAPPRYFSNLLQNISRKFFESKKRTLAWNSNEESQRPLHQVPVNMESLVRWSRILTGEFETFSTLILNDVET